MRVALIAPLVSPVRDAQLGGAQAVVADLAHALSGRGHDVVVYAARGSSIEGIVFAPLDIDSASLRADMFRDGSTAPPSAAMVAAYQAVYRHVRAGGFDVVHNHGFDTPAISVAAALRLAVLHTLHLPPGAAVAATLTGARRHGSVAWCATVSHSQAAAWSELVAVDAVLSNGVPVDEIPFNATGGADVVIAARFSAEKGVDDGIAAARRAGRRVDVYGTPYDDGCERAVRNRWRDDRGVRFQVPAARRDLWRVLGGAGAVICMSRWDEPFGMVAAEAAAAGTPVVASRRGGLPEVIEDGVTGYLVESGDVAAAAVAFGRVDSLRRDACRHRAVTALNLRDTVSAHEALYVRLAVAGRSPSF